MKILVLAGGSDQVALIKELQKRKHEVILLDYLTTPPAKKYVKKHIQESTLDSNKVREWAIKENVDMIATACTDQALLTVAKVSHELNLPCYLSYETALAVTNKQYMKEKMIASGIPTSKYFITNNAEDKYILNNLSFPLVVKPVDCNSSKGVVKINYQQDLGEAIKNAINLSRTHTAIIEEYKDGIEISADFYISNKVPILLGTTSSIKIQGTTGFTICGSTYPILSKSQQEKITQIAHQLVLCFDLRETPLLVQAILSNDNFYIIEFSARMGGGSKYRLIQEIAGVDIMAKYVDLIMGIKPEVQPISNEQFIRMIYIYSKPGRLSKINGYLDLVGDGTIKDWFIYKSMGTKIDKAETSSDRVMGVLVVANSEDEMYKKISKINSELSILNDLGQDIMIHNLIENYD